MEIVRFLTAGSVDDGKSTLIGRLLFETNSLKKDQLEAVSLTATTDETHINFAQITDGLREEREQGITIDVSYKYFTTINRRFIIADCPGHAEYTRNMFTGASNADFLVLLINAKNGVTSQTELHLKIANLLQIKQLIVCINKMDLVQFDEAIFGQIKEKILAHLPAFVKTPYFIPTCATTGENITVHSKKIEWYNDHSLLELLTSIPKELEVESPFCFPVQLLSKKDEIHYYMGTAIAGAIEIGDTVRLLPSNNVTKVKQIIQFEKSLPRLKKGQHAAIQLEDNLAVSRGELIVAEHEEKPHISRSVQAKLCWMDENALDTSLSYLIRIGTQETQCKLRKIRTETKTEGVQLNTLFEATIKTNQPIITAQYSTLKPLGCFILIDLMTHATIAGGVIL